MSSMVKSSKTKTKQVPAKKPLKRSKKTSRPNQKHRKIEAPRYKSFKLSKRIKHPGKPLTGSFTLFGRSVRHLLAHRKVFLSITLVYLLLTVVLVKGFGVSADVPELKSILEEAVGGEASGLLTGFTLYGVLVGGVGTAASEAAGAYQAMILIVISLALIWALRQTLAGEKTGLRDVFYRGMYPLIPFILILGVIALQLIPWVIANFMIGLLLAGVAVTGPEQLLWAMLILLLFILSVYMITSSVFALYIVSLPNVRPMQALRSARELVRYRRWSILRKLLFLPLALLVITAAITVPTILFLTPLAEWVFFVLSITALAIVHSYLYLLYREML